MYQAAREVWRGVAKLDFTETVTTVVFGLSSIFTDTIAYREAIRVALRVYIIGSQLLFGIRYM
jgi:hypothetical protein